MKYLGISFTAPMVRLYDQLRSNVSFSNHSDVAKKGRIWQVQFRQVYSYMGNA